MELDDWQQKVLDTEGNICLRSGRQVGKSTIIGIKAAKYSLENRNKLIMIISKTEKQAQLLFAKILFNLSQINRKEIMKGKDRPTKTRIKLHNGSVIYCLCAGDTGYGIMGYTIDLLIADEAAFIPEEVWNSVVPALAITRGNIWLLSTPFVKKGYYYDCFHDASFTSFHQSSEDCPRKDEVFLAHKKATLTKAQYAQMYLGLFVDELRQFFPDKLISNTCIGKRKPQNHEREHFLGVDIARMGEDESTFEIVEKIDNEHSVQIENIVTTKTLTTASTEMILRLNRQYDFKEIFIDAYALGVGVFDQLLTNPETRFKVRAIGHMSRPLTRDEKKKTKLMKEDLYNNLKSLMERNEIILLDDDEIKASLKSIQFEYINEKFKISGDYAHIADGVVFAAQGLKSKNLNIWVDYI